MTDTVTPTIDTMIADATAGDTKTWQSLCLTTDKAAAIYFSTFVLILIIVGFCCYQLVHKPDCSDQQAYLSVLGMILGVMLPSPVMSRQQH